MKDEIRETEESEATALVTVVDPMVSAEIDKQIATANAYPRSISVFKKTAMEMATLDEETAESCFYVLPRGGKNIEGPGVRLAEIVVSAWKHMRVEAKQVGEVQPGDKFVTVRGTAWDVQSNVSWSVETKRRIIDKYGKQYNEDMIGVTTNAACAIAGRNVAFKVVPSAYWRPIYLKCREIVKGDLQTLADRRASALEHFQKLGVSPDRVFAAIGVKDVDDITLDDLVTLKGLATALKEETTTIDEAFPKPEAPEAPKRKSELAKPAGGGDLPPEKSGVDGGTTGNDGAPPEGSGAKAKAGKAKKSDAEIEKRLADFRAFVKGPIEAIRDTPHQEFIAMIQGLKGDEFSTLLVEYNNRKQELK